MTGPQVRACRACLRRTWLLEALAGHLEQLRGQIDELLALGDDELIAAVAGDAAAAIEHGHTRFETGDARERIAAAGLEAVCRCDRGYPELLRALPAPPAVMHVAGGLDRLGALLAEVPVALVGARRATAYGRETARLLGAGCAAAGMTVVSGLALGIDAAAHEGALETGDTALAVLPGGADRAYPAGHRALYRRILGGGGAAVSELGPGVAPRRWMFPARNRLIAALSAMTVVVQARPRSGSLVTARWAQRLGRRVGAVPGSVSTELSVGPHTLLREGAQLIAGTQDVLDGVYGVGEVTMFAAPRPADPQLAALLEGLADGETVSGALRRAGLSAEAGLGALAALELSGIVRRGPGGRYEVRR